MWMVLYSTPFIYCRWVEWVNCWYLLGFTSFLHCRSIFYRSNFEGAPKARCLFETEKWILVSQHNLMTWSSCVLKSDFQNRTSWSEICKIIYPEARFLKDYFTDKRFVAHSEGPAFTTTCLWPRIWLVSHWARLAISVWHPHYHPHRCNRCHILCKWISAQ